MLLVYNPLLCFAILVSILVRHADFVFSFSTMFLLLNKSAFSCRLFVIVQLVGGNAMGLLLSQILGRHLMQSMT